MVLGVTRYYAIFCGGVGILVYFGAAFVFEANPVLSLFFGCFLSICAWGYGAIRSRLDAEFFDVWLIKRVAFDCQNKQDGHQYLP